MLKRCNATLGLVAKVKAVDGPTIMANVENKKEEANPSEDPVKEKVSE